MCTQSRPKSETVYSTLQHINVASVCTELKSQYQFRLKVFLSQQPNTRTINTTILYNQIVLFHMMLGHQEILIELMYHLSLSIVNVTGCQCVKTRTSRE